MAASFNKVHILGNLGNDPELRFTGNQVPVVTLNIATTDFRKGPDGQQQPHTEWHRVVVFNKAAENCAKYLKKGRAVFVEGKLQTRSWDDQNGQKRYSTEILAQSVQFIGGSRDEANFDRSADRGSGTSASAYNPAHQQGSELPTNDNFDLGPVSSVPDLDDIPF